MMKHGASARQATGQFWVLDHMGLVTRARNTPVSPAAAPFAKYVELHVP